MSNPSMHTFFLYLQCTCNFILVGFRGHWLRIWTENSRIKKKWRTKMQTLDWFRWNLVLAIFLESLITNINLKFAMFKMPFLISEFLSRFNASWNLSKTDSEFSTYRNLVVKYYWIKLWCLYFSTIIAAV